MVVGWAPRWTGQTERTSLLTLGASEIPLASAMIFLGASMCITAFPMLARIIHFKGLARTTMGTVAIGAGAIDDTFAWCLLAIVLAAIDNDWSHAMQSIGSGLGFVFVTIYIFKPLLAGMERYLVRNESLTEEGLVVGLACVTLGAGSQIPSISTPCSAHS